MDPLTHSLLGAAMARARLGAGQPLAMPCLVLAANAPDIDVFSYFWGADTALGFRRGWTHGPLGMLLLPIALSALLVLVARFRSADRATTMRALLPLAYLGVLTHPLLDWLNTYGVRLLMPFDGRWFYGDTLFIVDPWLWLVLGGCVAMGRPLRARTAVAWGLLALAMAFLVWAEPTARPAVQSAWSAGLMIVILLTVMRTIDRPRRAAAIALAVAALYSTALWVSNRSAERIIVERLTAAGPIVDVLVSPTATTPFRKDFVVETRSEYRLGRFDWLSPSRVELLASYPTPPASAAVVAARSDSCVQGFMRWVRFPVAEVDAAAAGTEVRFFDLRYTRRSTEGFGGATVRLDHRASDR